MIARTYSATLLGVNAVEVEIESSESPGLQFRMSIVGLPDTAVKESRDRVLSALRASGFYAPTSGTLTVNLAPANHRPAETVNATDRSTPFLPAGRSSLGQLSCGWPGSSKRLKSSGLMIHFAL